MALIVQYIIKLYYFIQQLYFHKTQHEIKKILQYFILGI